MTANEFKTYIVIREINGLGYNLFLCCGEGHIKLNGYGKRQAKENEKSQCLKGWETLDIFFIIG